MTISRSLVAAALVATASLAQDESGASPPNIVLIVSDDQGFQDVGYNNPGVYSPRLDALAKSGVTFAQAYVMPQCTPTRVALMTGRYPSRFGGAAMQASNAPAFPKGTPTVASMLKGAGFATHLCGKWHLGSSPEHGPGHFGFDHSYGSFTGAVGMYDHRYRKGKFANTWHRDHELIEGYENGTHATDLVAAEAVRIIEARRDRPFFLYVPFHSVHTPLDERGPFVDRPTQLDPKRPGRWLDEDDIEWFHDPEGIIQSEKDPEKRLYLAAVHHLDAAVGRIVDALDRSGKRKNTIIVFTSDNGPQVNWGGNAYPDDLKLTDFNPESPLRGKKLDVWDGGIRVPAFANWPGQVQPRVCEDPVHAVDWYPTLASIVGVQSGDNPDRDGIDLGTALHTKEPLPERPLYWTWSQRTNRWAVRKGRWKVVRYGKKVPEQGDWQLFDLEADPFEKNNLAEAKPEVLARMHQQFVALRAKDAR